VVPASFYDFFNGCASVAGALIGLLFVALSVSQEKLTGPDASLEHQIRAAAAFSALVNTLVIALVGLLPGASLGEVGLVLAIAGLATTAGSLALLYRERRRRISRGDVRLLSILIGLYALQLANAVQLNGTPRDVSGVARQGGLRWLSRRRWLGRGRHRGSGTGRPRGRNARRCAVAGRAERPGRRR
jgi:hypothetical protein